MEDAGKEANPTLDLELCGSDAGHGKGSTGMKTFVEGLKRYLREIGTSAISSDVSYWGFDGENPIRETHEKVDFDKLCAEIDAFAYTFTEAS